MKGYFTTVHHHAFSYLVETEEMKMGIQTAQEACVWTAWRDQAKLHHHKATQIIKTIGNIDSTQTEHLCYFISNLWRVLVRHFTPTAHHKQLMLILPGKWKLNQPAPDKRRVKNSLNVNSCIPSCLIWNLSSLSHRCGEARRIWPASNPKHSDRILKCHIVVFQPLDRCCKSHFNKELLNRVLQRLIMLFLCFLMEIEAQDFFSPLECGGSPKCSNCLFLFWFLLLCWILELIVAQQSEKGPTPGLIPQPTQTPLETWAGDRRLSSSPRRLSLPIKKKKIGPELELPQAAAAAPLGTCCSRPHPNRSSTPREKKKKSWKEVWTRLSRSWACDSAACPATCGHVESRRRGFFPPS